MTNDKKLQQLADSLNVDIDCLWDALQQQARIDSIWSIIVIIAFIIVMCLGYRFISWIDIKVAEGELPNWKEHHLGAIKLAFILVLIIGSIVIFMSIPGILSGFMNPEYWALEKFVELIGG